MTQTPPKRTGAHLVLYVFSFVPLLIYPFILLANVMSLCGYRSGDETFMQLFIPYSFLIFSTLYPLTLIYSLTKNKERKLFVSALPLLHVLISVVLCLFWMTMEG